MRDLTAFSSLLLVGLIYLGAAGKKGEAFSDKK